MTTYGDIEVAPTAATTSWGLRASLNGNVPGSV
jgi:hypothetical protein